MQRNGLEVQSHAEDDTDQDEAGDPHFDLALRAISTCTSFFLSSLDGFFVHSASSLSCYEMTANEECVYGDDEGERDTDPCEFEEAEGREACRGQRAGNDNVWRSTDHGDGAADVSGDSKRHQLFGNRELCYGADADDDRHQACDCTCVGGYSGENDGDCHDSSHQRDLVGACFFNDGYTDGFCQTGLEHSRTNNEHTAEENDGGIRHTCINGLGRKYAQNAQCSTCCHRGDSQRDQFGDEQECCHTQYAQRNNSGIHNLPSYVFL
ncbi:unknown [Dialister sp. CAG:486]|nr:unknown [Dialister sp. CAG:486]